MQAELLKRITVIPGLMGGNPIICGMRFPVKDILERLASGMAKEDIVEQHPSLESEDITAALLYKATCIPGAVRIHTA